MTREESSDPRPATEGNRAEDAQARLAAIIEGSDAAIVSKDLRGVVLTWNESGASDGRRSSATRGW